MCNIHVHVKSACEPSGPTGQSLSCFLLHKATMSISTDPRMGFLSIAGLPPVLSDTLISAVISYIQCVSQTLAQYYTGSSVFHGYKIH